MILAMNKLKNRGLRPIVVLVDERRKKLLFMSMTIGSSRKFCSISLINIAFTKARVSLQNASIGIKQILLCNYF